MSPLSPRSVGLRCRRSFAVEAVFFSQLWILMWILILSQINAKRTKRMKPVPVSNFIYSHPLCTFPTFYSKNWILLYGCSFNGNSTTRSNESKTPPPPHPRRLCRCYSVDVAHSLWISNQRRHGEEKRVGGLRCAFHDDCRITINPQCWFTMVSGGWLCRASEHWFC